ncbi:MAG: 2-phospho-L-lactate guanylyltransferase [Actinomycetota bacterium]
MDAGLLPVKALRRAKGRLSPHFTDTQRVEIAAALFEDALVLCESVPWLRWWVVSDDHAVLEAARQREFKPVADEGAGLNRALSLAIAEVARMGADSVTVLPSDVPLAYSEDLRDLYDTGMTSDVVVVPSGGDGGTNALWLAPPDLIEPRFGPGSLKAHVDAAEDRGLRCSILALPRLALDIDTIEDVDAFLARPAYGRSRTRAVLARLRSLPV